MVEREVFKIKEKSQRKVRFILLNAIRFILILVLFFAFFEGRRLILFTAIAVFVITFAPAIYTLIFKKDSNALFDFIIIIFILGLFSFWEIKGTYANNWLLAFFMNSAEAIALGFLGLTVVYTFFKHYKLSENSFAISFFSFCLAFTLGTVFELSKFVIDGIFNFSIHDAGLFGTAGNLTVYLAGAFAVSYAGYFFLRKGKPILVSKFLEEIVEKNTKFFGVKNINSENHANIVLELIKNGESDKLEFKSTLRKNLHTNNMDKQIEYAILKSVNAYLNSDGGTLLVGVSDNGEILGLDADQFESEDHAQRHLTHLINNHIGAEFLPFIQVKAVKIDGKSVLKIDCKKSHKETFLKNGKDDHFYVRQGSLSMPLSGSALVRYIESSFRDEHNGRL